MQKLKLLTVDGMSVFRRVYEAMPEAARSGEEGIAGIHRSCLASLRKAVRQSRPTHLFIALEGNGTSWRHELYPDYKSSRKPTPEDLTEAVKRLRETFRDEGVVCSSVDGYEADDVIACVVNKAVNAPVDLEIEVLTTDKDLYQLISENVSIRDHFKERVFTSEDVVEKFGVTPEKVHDFLALQGDSSDDIPGGKNIGPKTALKLLSQHENIEQIIEKADYLKPDLRKKVVNSADDILISKQLVSFKTDFDLGVKLSDGHISAHSYFAFN